MATPFKILLLGSFEIWREGKLVELSEWKNEKTKALLKILIGERGRVFSNDELIEWLWPDSSPVSAAGNLRARIAELRRWFEPHLKEANRSQYILTRPQGYCFSLTTDGNLDIEEFAGLTQKGREKETQQQFEQVVQIYEAALQLYRSDFLAEDRYAEWAAPLRAHYFELYLEMLARLAEAHARLGQYRRAMVRCRQILARQPTRESVYAQLMTYFYLAGDQAAALQTFAECEKTLSDNLGAVPSPSVKQLYAQILERHIPGIDQKYQPRSIQTYAVPYSLGQIPFVGRSHELQLLLRLLEESKTKRGAVALLSGEAGIGKSRLVQEIIAHAHKFGATVLQGRCQELAVQLPFQPIIQALRLALPQIDADVFASIPKFWLAELAKLLPELPSVAGLELTPSAALTPEQERLRLFDALTQFFVGVARRSSLVLLCIDDLQWADSTSLDYLNYVVPQLAQESFYILCTYRSEEMTRTPVTSTRDALGRELVYRLEIERLSLDEVANLIQQLNPSAKDRLIERLYEETEGNPFFLISTIQALFEEGVIRMGSDRSWTTEVDDITQNYKELLIPSQVKEVIARRLRSLGEAERELLQLASVVGNGAEYPVLQDAWPGASEKLSSVLEKLLERQLLRSRAGATIFVDFNHDKIRQFVYDSLSVLRRQEFHGRIGESLEKVHAGRLENFYGVLAHHFSLDTNPRKAFDYTQKTLDRAKQLYQNEEALRLVERGLELAEQVTQSDLYEGQRMRFELLHRRADVCHIMGRSTQQERDIRELFTLAPALQDNLFWAEAYWQRSRFYTAKSLYREALEDAEKGYAILNSESPNSSKHLLNLGAIHFYMNEYPKALSYYETALLQARERRDSEIEARTLNAIALIHARLGNHAKASELHEEALRLYRQLRHRRGECNALTNLGNLCYTAGRLHEALENFSSAYQISCEIGDRREQASVLTNQGNIDRRLGFYERALQRYLAAYTIRQELEDRRNQAGLLTSLGIVRNELGRVEEALQHYTDAQRLWDALKNRAGRALILNNLGVLQAQQKQLGLALTLYQEASTLYEELSDVTGYMRCLYEIGRVHLEMGNFSAALDVIERSLALAKQIESTEFQIKNYSLKGLISWMTGNRELALTESQQALSLLIDEIMLEHPHQVYLNHYHILEALGQTSEAKRFAEKAFQIVQGRANQLQDETLRKSYLENVSLNIEILKAWEHYAK